jgi:predicted phage terminase large subunit-like protein
MTYDRFVLDAVLRNDLACFISKSFLSVDSSQPYLHNWHIDVIADHLVKAFRRDIKRLVITLPPRSLKSISASVAFPAWALGQDPSLRFICASYSGDLAGKHGRDGRTIMESEWYQRVFPRTRINPKKSAESEYETTAGGYRLATSPGGTLTGRGAGFLIIDDAINPRDAMSLAKREGVKQWFDGTLFSRLDDKRNDVIIVIMQRVHVDDLVAHVLEKEGWIHLNLPAIAESHERFELDNGRIFARAPGDLLHPEREPATVLDDIKKNLGSFFFNAQYQQNPVPDGDSLVRWEWFPTYDLHPSWQEYDRYVCSWDTAIKTGNSNDYSVCTVWLVRKTEVYLIEVIRERLEYPDLIRRVVELANKHLYQPNDILIEDTGSGASLIQDLGAREKIYAIPIKPQSDKVTRMASATAPIEAGQVFIPKKAHWLGDFQAEILQFPYGRHDDQVDSMSQFLNWWREGKRRASGVIRLRGH